MQVRMQNRFAKMAPARRGVCALFTARKSQDGRWVSTEGVRVEQRHMERTKQTKWSNEKGRSGGNPK